MQDNQLKCPVIIYVHIILCGATAQIWHRPPRLRFLDHRQLDTHAVGLLWTNDNLVSEATT